MTPMSSLVSMPDPSMAESPLDCEEGVNECDMFSAVIDSAAHSSSGHSSIDEQCINAARDADDVSEVPDKATAHVGERRSSLTIRLRSEEQPANACTSSSSSFAERDKAESPPTAAQSSARRASGTAHGCCAPAAAHNDVPYSRARSRGLT